MIIISKPKPILKGSIGMFRGSGWYFSRLLCRSAYCQSATRFRVVQPTRFDGLGFRVALRKRDA
jgi:hypothetical protein